MYASCVTVAEYTDADAEKAWRGPPSPYAPPVITYSPLKPQVTVPPLRTEAQPFKNRQIGKITYGTSFELSQR
jgi:hypothetical protein